MIPDQQWLGIVDGVDETVLKPLEAGLIREPAASMRFRGILSRSVRILYQCNECGRLYMNDRHGVLHCFLPADETVPRSLLSGDGPHG